MFIGTSIILNERSILLAGWFGVRHNRDVEVPPWEVYRIYLITPTPISFNNFLVRVFFEGKFFIRN